MTTPAKAPASEPSHVTAKRELDALFATLGLTVEITGAYAAIDPESGHEGKGWPHVALTVTFTRPGSSADNRRAIIAAFPYKMGVGLIDWRAILKRTGVWADDYRQIKAMAGQGSLSPEGERLMAAKHVAAFVKRVNPAEVLALYCRDGEDASRQSFADWAANYGYDEDSRKALATYEACQQSGDKARRLVAHVPGAFAKLAALSCEL